MTLPNRHEKTVECVFCKGNTYKYCDKRDFSDEEWATLIDKLADKGWKLLKGPTTRMAVARVR